MIVVTVNWIDVNEDLPDDEITKMMAIKDMSTVYLGWKLEDRWFHDNGNPVIGIVTYWADLPEVPE